MNPKFRNQETRHGKKQNITTNQPSQLQPIRNTTAHRPTSNLNKVLLTNKCFFPSKTTRKPSYLSLACWHPSLPMQSQSYHYRNPQQLKGALLKLNGDSHTNNEYQRNPRK